VAHPENTSNAAAASAARRTDSGLKTLENIKLARNIVSPDNFSMKNTRKLMQQDFI
jgi:hypothetical protein